MKKQTIAKVFGISALALGTLVAGGYVMQPLLAETSLSIPAPIANIAKVFNLDPEKVMLAFNEGRSAEFEENLSTLVKEGKITETQKKKIVELQKAIETKRSALEGSGTTRESQRVQLEGEEKALNDYLVSEKLTGIVGLGRHGGGPEMLTVQLDNLVSTGKVTEAQKEEISKLQQAITVKRDELLAKNVTIEEMNTQMNTVEKALADYIQSQNLSSVISLGKGGERGGAGGVRR